MCTYIINSENIFKSDELFCEKRTLESKEISARILIQLNSYMLSAHRPKTESAQKLTSAGSWVFGGIKWLVIWITTKCSPKYPKIFEYEFYWIPTCIYVTINIRIHIHIFWISNYFDWQFVFVCRWWIFLFPCWWSLETLFPFSRLKLD